ncbi:MAG: GAF domain-containing protein [Anaerolineales bacterium]|nr:GAF domain-containing protein [Anaerolineales bacterium]
MTNFVDLTHTLRAENSRLKEENQDLRDELLDLRQVIHSLITLLQSLEKTTPETNPQLLLNKILSAALKAVDSRDGSLMLFDEESKELVFVQVIGASKEKLTGYRLPVGEGIAGWVAMNNSPKLVPDVRYEPLFTPQVDQVTGFQTISVISVPLCEKDRVVGVIEVVNTTSGTPFKESDLDILLLVAHLATQAILKAEGK